MDTTTPLIFDIYQIAKRAVESALTGAEKLLKGSQIVYALVRPPGHHAESRLFGGYCYFNNNAIAANYLSKHGKVAILDIDYHHGNGTQEIFYSRSDVFTLSIHGDPDFEYPFFAGFTDEEGEGEGFGYNYNVPLPRNVDGARYIHELIPLCEKIRIFSPKFLVVALGLDTAKGDPTGTWLLVSEDFEKIGEQIGLLKIPTLVVQEGGYLINHLGENALRFFRGFWRAFYNIPEEKKISKKAH
jgi:acetoin utilization deacetylase AcuC-like enzyme